MFMSRFQIVFNNFYFFDLQNLISVFGRVCVFQADLLVFSWYLLFIAGGRKKPWRGLKKSAGAKKNPSGGGKNTLAGIVHQHTGG